MSKINNNTVKKTTKKSAKKTTKKVVENKLIDIKIKMKKTVSRTRMAGTFSALTIAGYNIAFPYNKNTSYPCKGIEFIEDYPESGGSWSYPRVYINKDSVFIIKNFETKQFRYLKKWIREGKLEYSRVYKKRVKKEVKDELPQIAA